MTEIIGWTVSVVGIAVLTVIAEVILPEGTTRKYVKTTCGIVVAFVILQPIVKLLNKDVDYQEVYLQEEYLTAVDELKNGYVETSVKYKLEVSKIKYNDVTCVDDVITVSCNYSDVESIKNALSDVTNYQVVVVGDD